EPAFALPRKRMCDYALRVSDIWKVAKANLCFLLRSRKVRKEKHSNYCCYFYLHSLARMVRFVFARNVTLRTSRSYQLEKVDTGPMALMGRLPTPPVPKLPLTRQP